MTKKKITNLEKSTIITESAKSTKWCYVNTNNEFEYDGDLFYIYETVKEYKVYNKAGEVEDFTNEAYMDKVLVVVGLNDILSFYNQSYDLIDTYNVLKML